jgi:hypothetical protein
MWRTLGLLFLITAPLLWSPATAFFLSWLGAIVGVLPFTLIMTLLGAELSEFLWSSLP